MENENFNCANTMFSGKVADQAVRIKIVGIGGGGSNAIDKIKLDDLSEVHLAAVNTDIQALSQCLVHEKVQIGRNVTYGMGTGGDVATGLKAAQAEKQALEKMVRGNDLVFLVAGLGGGTGSGAAPYIANLASNAGAMVIAFVMLPFTFEAGRKKKAEEAYELMRKYCDAVIPLSNDLLLQLGSEEEETSFLDAFSQADEWVSRGIKSICSMLLKTGLINQDFSSLKHTFAERGGRTLFGIGTGSGENNVVDALDDLFLCPLLHGPEFSRRADNLLVHITGGPDLSISKVNRIMESLSERFGCHQNLALGAMIDDSLHQALEICVLGTTSLSNKGYPKPPAAAVSQNSIPDPADDPRSNSRDRTEKRHGAVSGKESAINPHSAPVHESKLNSARGKKKLWDQNEFEFLADEEQRGFFDKTERNYYDGEDLDVPTYMRRGIRIQLKE